MTKKRIVFLSLSFATLVLFIAGGVFGQQATQQPSVFRYLSIFSEVLDLVRSNYVEQAPTDQLLEAAFAGVTDALDEHSFYVPPAQMAAYKSFSEVEDNGIGLVVTKRFGYGYVVAPVAGSPAEKAGVERGDFIETIDGQPTQKMAVWQIRNALRARRPIKLQVVSSGQTKRETITVGQASFHPVALETEQFGSVAYVKIPYFEAATATQFREFLGSIRERGVKKLIVDVRGAAAGDVEQAIAAADHLLTNGVITSLHGRKIEPKRWQADRETAFDGEVQVLADMSTAAAGEIFASAIRGNNRGKLVGVTTYGKAITQRFIPLPSGGGVLMSVGHYTTPDLKPIKDTGVRPDVIVDLSSEALDAIDGKEQGPKDDLILDKALSLFGEKMPERAEAKKAA